MPRTPPVTLLEPVEGAAWHRWRVRAVLRSDGRDRFTALGTTATEAITELKKRIEMSVFISDHDRNLFLTTTETPVSLLSAKDEKRP